MFRKLCIVVVAGMAIGAVAIPTTASARWHGGGWHGGGWHGGGWHGGGWYGGGCCDYGGAFVAGAILGGLLAAPYYYGPPAGYYDYGPRPEGSVAYCIRRFKSYDPRTGTYLGYDGHRHPCP